MKDKFLLSLFLLILVSCFSFCESLKSCYTGTNSYQIGSCEENVTHCYIASYVSSGQSYFVKGCMNNCISGNNIQNGISITVTCCQTTNCNGDFVENGVKSCYMGTSSGEIMQKNCGGIFKYCVKSSYSSYSGESFISKGCDNTCNEGFASTNGISYFYNCCSTDNCNKTSKLVFNNFNILLLFMIFTFIMV